jgi:hypothetical protein
MKQQQAVFIIIILFYTAGIVKLSREINNLLTNDLNIIATKLDDIPFTNLNVQLVLLAYNCRDLLITWNVGNQDSLSSSSKPMNGHYITVTPPSVSTSSPESLSKTFGFQIVVREYLNLNNNNNNEKPMVNLNKTLRLYTSKYIDLNAKQNKFKLRNLLFNNVANYDICLVIYFDVIETVAFEKKCVQFNLPYSMYKKNKLCKVGNTNSGNNTDDGPPVNDMLSTAKLLPVTQKEKSATTATITTTIIQEETKVHTLDYDNESDSVEIESTTTTTTIDDDDDLNSEFYTTTAPIPFSTSNLTSMCSKIATSHAYTDCAQYSNLIIAFVVCIVFLATNIFMFSIILLHIVIKYLYLRKNRKLHQHQQHQQQSSINDTLDTSHHNRSRAFNPQTVMLSVSQMNHKRPFSMTTPYHQTQNICCMYDRCYKTDFTNYTKPVRSNAVQKPKRSKSFDFGHTLLSYLCCYTCPECEKHNNNNKKSTRDYVGYDDVSEINHKHKFEKSSSELARSGYILQVPNTGHLSPTQTPSSITTGSTISSFHRIRKSRKLSLFSLKRNQNNKQQDTSFEQSQLPKQTKLQQLRKSQFNSTYDHGGSMYDDDDDTFDSEIFYHYPSKQLGPQMSSAF